MLGAQVALEMATPTPFTAALLERNPVARSNDDGFSPISKMGYPDCHVQSTPFV